MRNDPGPTYTQVAKRLPLNEAEDAPRLDVSRREFLISFSQTAAAALIPSSLRRVHFPSLAPPGVVQSGDSPGAQFYLRPHYRGERPLDAVLLKVEAGTDQFIGEKWAEEIDAILAQWSASLKRSPRSPRSPQDVQAIASSLAENFSGLSLRAEESRLVRSYAGIEVHSNTFANAPVRDRQAFLREWQQYLVEFSRIELAEFQITRMDWISADPASARHVETAIRYEIAGTGGEFYREQRVGIWRLAWDLTSSGEWRVRSWRALEETQARSHAPIYVDIAAAALGGNSSYSSQLLHGTDYWRTVLDGACGIDIYGHNGVSAADIDNDGFDDLYICQPAGLPNRLYRNRGDGTFEDITESSGLGVLENTACALFADFNNDGWQDAILVLNGGPLLFLNDGKGHFQQKKDAFQFANVPQGTFVGAAVADYDRDGWLDIYFCLYSYYQGTGQYRYPSPYYAAENGPSNFLMRNQRDGTFRDVTAESGLDKNNTRYSFCCAWNDYNGDGWPDLYVVNDFGRKNLYRNNRDGTFTDVAAEAGAEDVGAGMSAAWLDYDRDGAPDIYVANMWTAAGLRVSMQDAFKKDSPEQIRALYQKHAMGNSLLRNRDAKFADVTTSSAVGIGRWAWSSDAFDFDHDGFPDLYITNGMVSGLQTADLNSFFWRHVVAKSPDVAGAALEYEQGWNALNELIRSDCTWSGYERNVFYVNNGDGTFSDISFVAGMDFVEDGRSFALADFDHDGRLETALKNRNAPQLRLLKNVVKDLPPSIAFRLKGTKSNRDAIGASITIETGAGRQTKSIQAASGFLSQHSKEVFFGLAEANAVQRAIIRWPSGLTQELKDLPANHRIWLEEGLEPSRTEPFRSSVAPVPVEPTPNAESLPTKCETWLLAPVPAPDFSLPDLAGKVRSLSALRGQPVLLGFWTIQSAECQAQLRSLQKSHSRWSRQGLQLITINMDNFTSSPKQNVQSRDLDEYMREQHLSFPIVRGSEDLAAVYNILYRQLFDRHRDLSLPASFLIDAEGLIVKIYQGSIVGDRIEHDFRNIPHTDSERLARALPFPGAQHTLEFGRNRLSLASLFFQRGYLDQAEVWFQQALRDNPSSAEALYGIGSVYLNQNKNAEARQAFERSLKLEASYPDTLPDAWNNLGVLATRENRVDDAIECFRQALKLSPRHGLSLDNLGNAYRLQKKWDEAGTTFQRALELAPDDPEANYGLGMVYAQQNDTAKAHDYLQRALKARPNYPEALNNLGVLYIMTNRRDEAAANFEQCIRVAPDFDQAYLNLARMYALEGAREKARAVLNDLLKRHPEHAQARQMLDQLSKDQLQ